jgi:hypothetical protein
VWSEGRATHRIWLLMPYLAWSSGVKSSGRMLADRSFWMPVCLLRRNAAMFGVEGASVLLRQRNLDEV